jgi:hypothetical protein
VNISNNLKKESANSDCSERLESAALSADAEEFVTSSVRNTSSPYPLLADKAVSPDAAKAPAIDAEAVESLTILDIPASTLPSATAAQWQQSNFDPAVASPPQDAVHATSKPGSSLPEMKQLDERQTNVGKEDWDLGKTGLGQLLIDLRLVMS